MSRTGAPLDELVDFASPARNRLRSRVGAARRDHRRGPGDWEALAASGWLFRDVVPSLAGDRPRGRARARRRADFYANLGVTAHEIGVALAIGGIAGLAVGIAARRQPLPVARAYEALLYYLGPTPKIIFFPVMIMWFGVGPGSKIAMGALSCFFPIAISAAAGMRQIDAGADPRRPELSRVAVADDADDLPAGDARRRSSTGSGSGSASRSSARCSPRPSCRTAGLGYLIIQAYATFDMPRMYALLIVLFVLAIGLNALIGRYAVSDRARSS